MDGFYDQQVPFMVPPSVSGQHKHVSLAHSMAVSLSPWLESMDGWVSGWQRGPIFLTSDLFLFPSSLLQHNSGVKEPTNHRTLNERKRKFVDTELAQDTEGNVANIASIFFTFFLFLVDMVLYIFSGDDSWFFSVVAELFQDLSQLQEIWIAEGKIDVFGLPLGIISKFKLTTTMSFATRSLVFNAFKSSWVLSMFLDVNILTLGMTWDDRLTQECHPMVFFR